METTQTAEKPKAEKKAKSPSTCWCGCGTNTFSKFAPGHDAKVKGRIARVIALEDNAKATKLAKMKTGDEPEFDPRVLENLDTLFHGRFADYK